MRLIIFSSLFFVVQSQVFFSFDSTLNPDVLLRNCSLGETCNGSINSTAVHYFAIEYSFDPTKAVRVVTKMNYKLDQDAPLLVVVRQARGVNSWTLPYIFSNGMVYSSVARILCLYNELNRTKIHLSRVFIEISTSNVELISYSVRLENIGEYSIETKKKQTIEISPTMPVFFRYTFQPDVTNIFIEVQSNDSLCAVVSVQALSCPVYDVNEIGNRQGHFQTMSGRASFNINFREEFPNRNEFLLVFTVKPTDYDCLEYQKRTPIQPAGFIDIVRVKNATVIITQPTYDKFVYLTIFATFAVFFLFYLVAFGIMMKRKDIYDLFDPTKIPTSPPNEQELPELSTTQTTEGEENIVETNERFDRSISVVAILPTTKTGFVTVQELCAKKYNDLKEKFRIYPQTMLTIAIFYSLPVIQLVLQFQLNIESSGNEDLCYFNFLCARPFAKLTAFNNVFSNVGYCALGILFFLVVYRRDRAYSNYLVKHPEEEKLLGIPQHFGLYYAMAIGLFMEGVMSACYHVCPSKQNFQFDTSFMFIIAVLNVIKIYQKRHPDINPRSAGAFSFLAFLIFVNVIGVYYDKQWFWITYTIVHILLCFIFMGKIYYMGRLKISFRVFIHLYKLMTNKGFFSRPLYLSRMWLLVFAALLNIGFALYGSIYQPESFPNHLLFILLGNLALYLSYYIVMKTIHREKFRLSSIVYLSASIGFWIVSLYFFYQEVKSYEVQPAISRTRNQACVLLETYDVHDVWHLLSSFGLFFSFMTILTIDDGVRDRKRKELAAF